ncbi:MAG: aminotransferase class I/II-fold pyridoxal phosphate-dependent enzyme [Muribaculaceae bacterium]|nr:aminotransferase class I/II-fold pyridoxal phosphate-dependent enzyme [Muribaculaceae bacterium]
MISFNCDYMEGAHPLILERLAQINTQKISGYGLDEYCMRAKEKIRAACRRPQADVQFLVGGTQTNTIAIDAMLRHNEGVIAATSGHINVHEAGAIEACGHKVMAVPATLGKIDIDALENLLAASTAEFDAVGWEHYVVPRAVYASFPTEYGTLYTLEELRRLRSICDRYHLYLYVDGARMGYGLAAAEDVDLPQLAQLADVFYLGGTKMGALFGEAVVVCNPNISLSRGLIKQRGALLAKGWLLGVQFDILMTDGLYWELGRNAVRQAMKMRKTLVAKGWASYIDSPTNQQFFVIPNESVNRLKTQVGFDIIEAADANHTVVRLCTSWATTSAQIEELIDAIG